MKFKKSKSQIHPAEEKSNFTSRLKNNKFIANENNFNNEVEYNDEEENEKQQDVEENRNKTQIEIMFPNDPAYQAYLNQYGVRFYKGGIRRKLKKKVSLDCDN